MRFEQDVAFNEFECCPDFVPLEFLCDVIPRSQIYGGNNTLHMDYVQDGIASRLMGEL
jgi:hypothetical protein